MSFFFFFPPSNPFPPVTSLYRLMQFSEMAFCENIQAYSPRQQRETHQTVLHFHTALEFSGALRLARSYLSVRRPRGDVAVIFSTMRR